jgi:hypothetical protein
MVEEINAKIGRLNDIITTIVDAVLDGNTVIVLTEDVNDPIVLYACKLILDNKIEIDINAQYHHITKEFNGYSIKKKGLKISDN